MSYKSSVLIKKNKREKLSDIFLIILLSYKEEL